MTTPAERSHGGRPAAKWERVAPVAALRSIAASRPKAQIVQKPPPSLLAAVREKAARARIR